VPGDDRDQVWFAVVDSVDDYFRIEREERVKLVGNVLTEGRIDTYPEVGSTLLEPWRRDSVGSAEKWESTLQSIRRRGLVRIMPERDGFLLDVQVYQELEDVPRPEFASVGNATFRHDSSLARFKEPVGGQVPTVGWIPQGRDAALEQRILGGVLSRLSAAGRPGPPPEGGFPPVH
jgi:hypothetical protein